MDAKELLVEQIAKELLKSKESGNVEKLMNQYGFLLSNDIADAISPVNTLNAAITITYLETYAAEIRKRFPDAAKQAEKFKKNNIITIEQKVR